VNEQRAKPKSNAVLKNLPAERQEQIAEWCVKPNDLDEETKKPIPGTGGFAFARAQLAADGLKVSHSVLVEFFKWWQLEQDLEASFERERQVLEKTGDPLKARQAGETLLIRLGIASQDPKLIMAAAQVADSRRSLDLSERSAQTKARQKDVSLKQKDRDLQLAERRVLLLEENAAKAKQTLEAVKKSGGLSPEALAQIEEAAKLL
jgi:hypothetical protein